MPAGYRRVLAAIIMGTPRRDEWLPGEWTTGVHVVWWLTRHLMDREIEMIQCVGGRKEDTGPRPAAERGRGGEGAYGGLMRLLVVGAMCAGVVPPTAFGQEWAQFRGPNGAGHAKGDGIPVQWAEKDYNWKVKLPGTGHGSPALWGEKIFLLCADEKAATMIVTCLSAANGGTVWAKTYKSEPFAKNRDNHFAISTPAVDAKGVYVVWGSRRKLTLLAMDHDGKELWQRDLGAHESQHGPGLSLLAYEGLVVVPNDQQGESFILAVDGATGTTRWKLKRPTGLAAYSTPCVRRPAGGEAELIFSSSASGVTAVDPATGQVKWDCPGVCPRRCVSTPVLAGERVVVTSGTGGRGILFAVEPTSGKEAKVAYRIEKDAPYVPSPLVKGDLMFLLGDGGGVSCVRAATGEVVWKDKLPDRFYGSFVCVGERLYCLSRTGSAYVLAAGEKFELLAKNALGEGSFATPAVAGGRMYLRTFSHLISLGGKAAAE